LAQRLGLLFVVPGELGRLVVGGCVARVGGRAAAGSPALAGALPGTFFAAAVFVLAVAAGLAVPTVLADADAATGFAAAFAAGLAGGLVAGFAAALAGADLAGVFAGVFAGALPGERLTAAVTCLVALAAASVFLARAGATSLGCC